MTTHPGRWRAALLIWLAIVASVTLRSAPSQVEAIARLHWYCLVCGDSGAADVLLNILLFFPFGVALSALGWPLARTVAVLMALSIAIEVTQGNLLMGRSGAVGDVLSNTSGGLIGWLGLPILLALTRLRARAARAGAIAVLTGMIVIWLGTAAALKPSLTGPAPWFGQPLHVWPGYQPFPGTLQRATMNGIDIPNDTLSRLPDWRDSLAVEIEATRSTADILQRGISVVRVVDAEGDVQVAVSQDRDAARLRLRLHGSDWRLHSQAWLVDHGLPMAARVPWRFRAEWTRDAIVVTSEPVDGPHRPVIRIPLSIGLGWVFIHPFVTTIDSHATLWTVLWLGWWFGLLGWLAGWTNPPERWLFGAVAIAAFVAAGVATGLTILPTEIAAAAVAYVIAALIAGRLKERRDPRHQP